MANREINIKIDGDASGFKQAAGDVTGAAQGMDKSLRNSAVGGAVAGVAMAGVTMALGAVTDFLGGASEAAREDTASQDRLKLALENTGKAQALTTDQIEAAITANQAKGVSDSAQRQGISDFLDITGDATKAMELNQATTELAAAKGIAYADAEAMIISAAAGKTAALRKAGVEIQAGADITQIAAAVNDSFAGSLDSLAETQGGKATIAQEKMGEAMEKVGTVINNVGAVLLPVLADALTWVVDNVVPPVQAAFEVLGPILGGVFGVIGKAAQGWAAIIGGVFTVVGTAISVLVSAFQGIATVVGNVFGSIGGIIKGAINVVIDIINGAIGAINRIQVHIHVGPVGYDFNGLNLGKIPRLHSGGIVPGAAGSEVLTVLQAGERVTPAGAGGMGQTIVVNIASFVGSDRDIDRFTDRIALRLRMQGVR